MPASKVSFHFQTPAFYFPNRNKLKAFIETLFKKEKKQFERLDYVFCNDSFLLKMNQDFLLHDTYTDIITFDLSESSQTVGEIYISIDRVQENAKQFNCSLQTELYRVIFHGALHLCGYGDKRNDDKKIMRQKEEQYLKMYERLS